MRDTTLTLGELLAALTALAATHGADTPVRGVAPWGAGVQEQNLHTPTAAAGTIWLRVTSRLDQTEPSELDAPGSVEYRRATTALRGAPGGACFTPGCENRARWISIYEATHPHALGRYRCQPCCDRIAADRQSVADEQGPSS